MNYSERKIVAMLQADAFKHPVLLEYIKAIEAGAHLGDQFARAEKLTADIKDQSAAFVERLFASNPRAA